MPFITSKMKEREYIQAGSCAVGVRTSGESNHETQVSSALTPVACSVSPQQLDDEEGSYLSVESNNRNSLGATPAGLYQSGWGYEDRSGAPSPESIQPIPHGHETKDCEKNEPTPEWNPQRDALRPTLWNPNWGSEYHICPYDCSHGRVVEQVPAYTRVKVEVEEIVAVPPTAILPRRNAFNTINGEVIPFAIQQKTTSPTFNNFGVDDSSSMTLGKRKLSLQSKITSIVVFNACVCLITFVVFMMLARKLHIAAGVILAFLLVCGGVKSAIHVLYAFGHERRWVPVKKARQARAVTMV